jgi:hypothetical protein
MFDSLTSYNRSLNTFRKAIHGELDISRPVHPGALLKWLNEWGCRHLAKEQHHVASESIREWYETEGRPLAGIRQHLWLLDEAELERASIAYGTLKDRIGARSHRDGKDGAITIGPTAASKILFALSPEAFAPWDDAMRKHFGCDGSAESYVRFLGIVRALAISIGAQCEKSGFPIERLPKELKRPGATVVSLLNEYLWVSISAKAKLPSQGTLAAWAKW